MSVSDECAVLVLLPRDFGNEVPWIYGMGLAWPPGPPEKAYKPSLLRLLYLLKTY